MVNTSPGPLEEVDDSFNFFLQQLQIEMVHTSTGPLSNLDRGPLIIFCTIIILYISIVCYFLSASFGVQDPILCQSSLLAIRPCIIAKYMAILIDLKMYSLYARKIAIVTQNLGGGTICV